MKNHRSWIGIGIGFAVIAIIAILAYVFIQEPEGPMHAATPAPVRDEPLTPTNQQQVRSWFGPWSSVRSGNAGAPALVMLLDNGGTDVSSWRVSVTKKWRRAAVTPITAATPSGGVAKLRTDKGQAYSVRYGQPFVLERIPDRVYALAPGRGSRPVVMSISAKWIHTHGQRK